MPGHISAPQWSGWQSGVYPEYRAVLTSLGCRYGCSFCFESKLEFRSFDFAATVEPIVAAGITRLAIEDSTVFGAHGAERLAESTETLDRPIEYTCYALVNEVFRSDIRLLEKLRRGGLTSVIMGIESPDSRVMRLYRKSVDMDRVHIAIDKLHDAGIMVQGCLMVGIPEVSFDDTLYTLEYALDLDIDVRRWHVFQPSFSAPPRQIETPRPLSAEHFARIEVNVSDRLLPQLFSDAPTELLLEEHFLMRAIPYVREVPDCLRRVRYAAGYTLYDLYTRLLDALKHTKASFNEEDYYAFLGSAQDRQPTYDKRQLIASVVHENATQAASA